MDILTEELDNKEYELAELMQEHEAVLEYETMVEEMTEEILRKEADIGEWQKKFKQSEDTITIQESYTENLEQFNLELVEEAAKLKADIEKMEIERQQDEALLMDLDDDNQNYAKKVAGLNQTISELSSQLETTVSETGDKSRVQVLIDAQNSLMNKVREAEKKEIDGLANKIDFHWQNAVKQRVVENVIPPRL
jgi:chromosome segregation ATPase